jgi:uncharacterized protein Yka (UPF0111/DUF47 family)
MGVVHLRNRRDDELSELFADSGRNVLRTAEVLHDLVVSWPDQGRLAEIGALERTGDRIAHEILRRVAQQSSPQDAADMHALAGALDDVVDHAEEAADRLALYRVEATTDQAVEITELLMLAAREVAFALESLAHGEELSQRLIEIHRLENHTDRIVRAAVAALFGDGIDPMVVIRWKDIYDAMEAAADACETVANVLEGVCLRRGHALRWSHPHNAAVHIR